MDFTIWLQLAPLLLKALVGDGLDHEYSRCRRVVQLRTTATLNDISEINEDVAVLLQKLMPLRGSCSGDDRGQQCEHVLDELAKVGVSLPMHDGNDGINEIHCDYDVRDVYDMAMQSYLQRFVSFAAAVKSGMSDVIPLSLVQILSPSELSLLIRRGGSWSTKST